MERVTKGDNAVTAGIGTRHFNGILYRFRPGGEEGRFRRTGDGNPLINTLGQCDVAFVRGDLESRMGKLC